MMSGIDYLLTGVGVAIGLSGVCDLVDHLAKLRYGKCSMLDQCDLKRKFEDQYQIADTVRRMHTLKTGDMLLEAEFSVLHPKVVSLGDFYLAPIQGQIQEFLPANVVGLQDAGFSFSGQYVAGQHLYDVTPGLLIKMGQDKICVYADPGNSNFNPYPPLFSDHSKS